MAPLTLQCLVLLAGSIAPAAAIGIPAEQRERPRAPVPAPAVTPAPLHQGQYAVRQVGTAVQTRFTKVYSVGGTSSSRIPVEGHEYHVDLNRDLWGVCTTAATDISDCYLIDRCVDSFACSTGCGKPSSTQAAFTCTDSESAYCSTALLTLAGDLGPFSYIRCDTTSGTKSYKPFTTPSSAPASTTSSSSTSVNEPGLSIESVSEGSSPTSTSSTASSSSASAGGNNSNPPGSNAGGSTDGGDSAAQGSNSGSNNNIGAIVGGVVGCLALVCISVIAIIWMRKRNKPDTPPAPVPAGGAGGPPPVMADGMGGAYAATTPSSTAATAVGVPGGPAGPGGFYSPYYANTYKSGAVSSYGETTPGGVPVPMGMGPQPPMQEMPPNAGIYEAPIYNPAAPIHELPSAAQQQQWRQQ